MSGFVEAVLNVLAIVALISATAFIIIFLVDLLMSIKNKNGSIFFRNKSSTAETKPVVESKPEVSAQPVAVEESIRPQVLSQQESQEQTWDEEMARREREEIERASALRVNEEAELEAAKQQDIEAQNNKRQLVDDFDDFDSLFADVTPKQVVESEENFDDIINEINKESVTKYEESKKTQIVEPLKEVLAPVTTKETEDFGIKFDDDLDDFDALFGVEEEKSTIKATSASSEIEDLESLFESKEETTTTTTTTTVTEETSSVVAESVASQTSTVVPVAVAAPVEYVAPEIINVYEYFPIDALNDRLLKLQERLKSNERDLKANRKEYNPLARVNRSLKRDQEKLRRREAIVARKKVMLYGVNNYVDIDEEKAKKLSEDLDLLDGLRLSVQHCEEVMEQNKDRFPILEKTNQILVEQNKHLKDDIAEVKAAIEKLNAESNDAE